MSQRFHFRLASVQNLRAADERRAKELLAATMQAREQERRMADSARRLAAAADDGARRQAGETASAADMMAAQQWRERIQHHRTAAERQLEQADAEVALSRRELLAAHRRRSEIDLLHDAALVKHRREQERTEAARLDELSQQMFLARRNRTA